MATPIKRSSWRLVLFCAAAYLPAVVRLYLAIVKRTGGHFVYALDDPYIHLALAENLAHGHYGINAAEFASPSSSILWPFLLIPFAGTAVHLYVPLFWNILFGLVSACLIGGAVARWPPHVDEQGRMPWWQQAVTAVLLMFAANLPGLTFLGMEHVLQVMLAICCSIALAEALSGRPVPVWCLVAAAIAPMVRYENLSLTLAVCIVLAGLESWKKAWAVAGLAVAPLIAFSAYLHAKGLPLLPLSVLVRGSAYASDYTGANLFIKLSKVIYNNLHQDVTETERYPMLILFLIFVGLAWTASTRRRRVIFWAAATLGILQLTIGPFGWFHRYEVDAAIFLLFFCMRVLGERPGYVFGYFALGLVFCASPYIEATRMTPAASLEIYQQQYQMHRFVKDFYHGGYAICDLGLASFERAPGAYVLDLAGLGSAEAARQSDPSAAWVEDIVRRHGIRLAILYPDWLPIPLSWTPVAQMCVPNAQRVVVSQRCVFFYSTWPDGEAILRADLARFVPTLPREVLFYWEPSASAVGPRGR